MKSSTPAFPYDVKLDSCQETRGWHGRTIKWEVEGDCNRFTHSNTHTCTHITTLHMLIYMPGVITKIRLFLNCCQIYLLPFLANVTVQIIKLSNPLIATPQVYSPLPPLTTPGCDITGSRNITGCLFSISHITYV